MLIDGRERILDELLKELRVLFPSCADDSVMEVLLASQDSARKVKAFAAMSGFRTSLQRESDGYRVTISGSSCGCFR